jgi:hypothetical protein
VRLLAPIFLVAAVPVLGFMAVHHDQHVNEQRLGRIASEIAGRDVDVRCPGVLQRLADVSPNAGSVYFAADGQPGDYTELNDETCAALDDYAEGHTDAGDVPRVARAMHVLAHESWHLAGVRDEAAADCFGLQRTAFVAEALGADPSDARGFAQLALAERAQTAPPEYRSAECHDGGALDLDLDPTVWP